MAGIEEEKAHRVSTNLVLERWSGSRRNGGTSSLRSLGVFLELAPDLGGLRGLRSEGIVQVELKLLSNERGIPG